MASRPLWKLLSGLETAVVADEIEKQRIKQPVYVTGIARAGTTIVSEMLACSPQLTSHQYADFPFLFTPFWRNWLAQRSQLATPAVVERAHRDRIQITHASAEAFEEVLWMAFDRDLHRSRAITPMDEGQAPKGFGPFYQQHIKKLLAVRNRPRYLAKGNYNLLRIPWLVDQMDNPRFVLMVRHPRWHIASLMKQHALFLQAQQADPRTGGQLAASGHFEFGPLRRAAAYQGMALQQQVTRLWESGEEVRGWARLWAQGYALALQYQADPSLAPHLLVVRYEDLCAKPEATIDAIARHCGLEDFANITQQYCQRLSPPEYYQPDFSALEQQAIDEETAELASRLGYGSVA